MPYIVVTGQLNAPQLGGADCTLVAGLSSQERDKFVAEMEAVGPGSSKVSGSGSVRVDGRGRVLQLLNILHHAYGYHVISHSMAVSSTNQERMSWTLFRKSSSTSGGVTSSSIGF